METQPALSPEDLYVQFESQLAALAQRAVQSGREPMHVVVVLVDADDPKWGTFAAALGGTDVDRQAMRDRGERPVRLCSCSSAIVAHIVAEDLQLSEALWRNASQDMVRTVIMSDGRAIVRYLEPRPQQQPS